MLNDIDVTYTLLDRDPEAEEEIFTCHFLNMDDFEKFTRTLIRFSLRELVGFDIHGCLGKEGD